MNCHFILVICTILFKKLFSRVCKTFLQLKFLIKIIFHGGKASNLFKKLSSLWKIFRYFMKKKNVLNLFSCLNYFRTTDFYSRKMGEKKESGNQGLPRLSCVIKNCKMLKAFTVTGFCELQPNFHRYSLLIPHISPSIEGYHVQSVSEFIYAKK